MIAEAAAALSLLLPLTVMLVFVALEVSHAYLIKNALSEAAREAARNLAIAYGQNRTVATSRDLQDSSSFDKVRITNMVNDSEQFDDPEFSTTADPPVVSVTVRYKSAQYGLPQFPNPDPLNIGTNLEIASSSTYRLQ